MGEFSSNFKQLINRNPTYSKAVAKDCGLESLPIDVAVGGVFRKGRFIFPPFLGFVSADIVDGQPFPVYYLLCLKCPRPHIVKMTILKLQHILAKVAYSGFVFFSTSTASFSLLEDSHPFVRLFKFGTRKDLGYKIVTSKQWLCMFNGRFGEGTSPTIALRQCGGSGEVSSRYIRLRKEHLI